MDAQQETGSGAPAGPAGGAALPDLSRYDAVLFDLDGVLTPTADVHREAWRTLFEAYFRERGVAPYTERDYYEHLDGLQRYDGVAKILASRAIELPWGDPDDPPYEESVCGLGNRKNRAFAQVLEREGVTPFPGAVLLLDALGAAGVPVAVVSGSRNAPAVLASAGLSARFGIVVDGVVAAEIGLPSKPSPAAFLHAAAALGVAPANAVVVEDAISGVEAGRAGGFGLVVGVSGTQEPDQLATAGADVVVAELTPLAQAVSAHGMDRERFPIDEWQLLERVRPAGADGLAETLFALGNGYLGIRGTLEESGPAHENGTFVNGFHETWPIRYPEAAYGFATVGQTIVNVPDAKTVRFWLDGEAIDPSSMDVVDHERRLDLRHGELHRRGTFRAASGKRVSFESSRLVSFARKNLAQFEYRVTALDGPVEFRFETSIINRQDGQGDLAGRPATEGFDPRRADELSGRVLALEATLPPEGAVPGNAATAPEPPPEHAASGRSAGALGSSLLGVVYRTRNSGAAIAVVAHQEPAGISVVEPDATRTTVVRSLAAGETFECIRHVVWLDGEEDADVLLRRAAQLIEDAVGDGAAALRAEQRAWCDAFWEDADVVVEGHPDLQQAIRWNLFQLAQAAARADGRGVSAKGVSGSGYSGHYFWDTEIYVLPFLTYVMPTAARKALEFRHSLLDAARRRAWVMNVAGALFPWRTINGEEASAYYPAGTAQYHIDADIAYAVLRYGAATGDREFMRGPGTELLIETARMWRSLGFFGGDPERFHLHSVTGPDEYSAVVNDNFYTNAMARRNLSAAARVAEAAPGALGTDPQEIAEWRRAAAAMAFPFDERLGINAQDAEFLSRERWDLAATPREKRPLLLHYHPLVIYRHQVLKQADLILAEFLLGSEFSADQKRRDFEYYDPLTTGDSTLSAAVQSIMAAEVGYQRRAMRHFRRMLFTDLADLHGNTADGVHVAAMGGTWLALVCGFGGLRDDSGTLRFDPRLPAAFPALRFRLAWRGSRLQVHLRADAVTFSLLAGPRVHVNVRGEEYVVDGALEVPLADQGPTLDALQ